MGSRRSGLVSWVGDHRAQYNRWADRHTWLMAVILAALLAFLLVVIAARLSHAPAPLPDVSATPHTDQGRLS